ncbi:DUF2252 domain-containing protein [Microbacterium sp. C5A9]|uniref:DUF2252 domain-containing protein n=1 Tax=Microbacterium sp. C5A9 TaxID=2736663 RepID=UPI001F526997|nr:DUF2252 domain-containing protein [Microbacterium sp. C5A9]MCI1020335.1 DUF2252 domain-containing protein [Microbacterium sp. C5A9]
MNAGRAGDIAAPVADPFAARREAGRAARARMPRAMLAPWAPSPERPDPISLLEEQGRSRVPELVPVRYARMATSPLAFYRGAALIMASDLAATGHTGIIAQLCGDAHLSNFGLYRTPERALTFDINDFDETLPGPFEWDVKRLAASFAVACRQRGFRSEEQRACTLAAAHGYRSSIRSAAKSTVLDAWYDRFDADRARRWLREERRDDRAGDGEVRRLDAVIAKAGTRDHRRAFRKLVRVVDGDLRIAAAPPLIVPVEDILRDSGAVAEAEAMHEVLASYQKTLIGDRHPIAEYRYRHMARKVVGVGSVGTRAWVILLSGRDDDDPLLLQGKEAQASVLERFLGPSEFESHGERVVRGQRLMQSSSDLFLGWQSITAVDGQHRDFYVRQLQDGKGGIDPDAMTVRGAILYARICGETLGRAHSRSGDRVEIAGYLGRGSAFETAIADFAAAYAEQNQSDFDALTEALASGRLPRAHEAG